MASEDRAAPERRLADNPFYVLGLRPACSRLDVEREGQKLLGMLELGLKAAAAYMTPLGPQPRTADKVRTAMAELRAPDKRLLHEFWAVLPPAPEPPKPPPHERPANDLAPLEGAFGLLGLEAIVTVGAVLGAFILAAAITAWLYLLLQVIEPVVWWAIRRGPARRGWVRVSSWLAWLCRGLFEADPRGGRALAGALALASRRAHDEGLATWLEGQLGEKGKLGAAGVAAAGLIAASRGQRDGARDMMTGAAHWEAAAPGPARVIAGEWLVADAAERGDWPTVMRLGVRDGIASPTTRFLAFAAARIRREPLIGEPSATDVGLRWLWWRAAGRRRLRGLLQQALATPRVLHHRKPQAPAPVQVSAPVLDPAVFAGDPLAHAQALHALWSTTPELDKQLTPTRAAELCKAWDAAFAGPVLARLSERARALTVVIKPEVAAAQLRYTVGEEIAALAARALLPLPALAEAGGIGAEAAGILRGELILGVEKLSQALRTRTKDKKALPSVDELREWNALKRAYDRAATLGGLEVRRVMFPDVHLNVCNYAVWLWNDRKEYGISGPLFRWLLAEAEAVGDEEAIALQKKNVGTK